jgi:hypothetical protein
LCAEAGLLILLDSNLLLAHSCFLFLRVLFGSFFRAFPSWFLVFFLQLGTDELEDREFGPIAKPPANANDSRIAAGTLGETRSEIGKELLRCTHRHKESSSLPARVKRISFAERDHSFGNWLRSFGAQQRGLNALLLDQIRDEIAEHSATMRWLLSEFGTGNKVSHGCDRGLERRGISFGRRGSCLAWERRPDDTAVLVELHSKAEAHLH